MKIVVLSDTHIPRSASDLQLSIYDDIRDADLVLHAGDFVEKSLYDKLSGMCRIVAVYGNMDPIELRRELKEKEIVDIDGFKIGIIHGYGSPRDLVNTVKSEFTDVDAIVFGHSHSSLNILKDGILFFNPGSPTDKVFASANSYGILTTGKKLEGKIIEVK